MTTKMTVEEYQQLMRAGGNSKDSNEVMRLKALLLLLRQLLDEGHRIRLEYRFHPTRKWRFDIALPDLKIGIEIDGFGIGHYSIKGREQDNEKNNAAIALGWAVPRYAWRHVKSGEALTDIQRIVASRKEVTNGGNEEG